MHLGVPWKTPRRGAPQAHNWPGQFAAGATAVPDAFEWARAKDANLLTTQTAPRMFPNLSPTTSVLAPEGPGEVTLDLQLFSCFLL